MYTYFLQDLDLRLLQLLKDLEPSLSEENLSLFALLLGCRSRGDTRLILDSQNIKTVFQTKIRSLIKKNISETEISSFLDQCIKTAEKVKEHAFSSIIGSPTSTSHPLILENQSIYIQKYYIAKESIQKKIKLLFSVASNKNVSSNDIPEGAILHPKQAEAVYKGSYQNLIITGGPGTGKTTVVFYILKNLLSQNNERAIYLAAPSGKAAGRMQESIRNSISKIELPPEILERFQNIESKTIHRLLKFNPKTNRFFYNAQNPFPDDGIFIIDEASMIDIEMFANLLEAIPIKSRIFLLGDENQLSSVDAGAVLGDLLVNLCSESVVRLTHSFRSNTEIQTLANAVNQAPPLEINPPLLWNTVDSIQKKDTGILAIKTPKTPKEWAMLLDSWIQEHYQPFEEKLAVLEESLNNKKLPFLITDTDLMLIESCHNAWKIMNQAKILCAERHGIQGTINLNQFIQSKISHFSLILITQNLYSHGLFNGDTGLVLGLNTKPFIVIQRSKQYEVFPLSYLPKDTYETAFAMTIHKSQGSEFDHVMIILPTDLQHLLLSKQILYTGITRAKKLCSIIAEEKAFVVAAGKKESRETGLI